MKPTYEELLAENVKQKTQIEMLQAQVASLMAQVEDLKRQLNRNSNNSSMPPSSDLPHVEHRKKKPTGRKTGGQPGHEGHCREMAPPEDVDKIVPHKPDTCPNCGSALHGDDPNPQIHQVWEIPPVKPHVTENQIHTLTCSKCGTHVTANLHVNVPTGNFGPNLVAFIGLASGVYRMSKRMIRSLLTCWFRIPISIGGINICEKRTSAALAGPYDEAHRFVQTQGTAHVDETSWKERLQKFWLWVMATSFVTVFKIQSGRTKQEVLKLLGEFAGTLVSDRFGAYNVYKKIRQACWAHLNRDLESISEYNGKTGKIGQMLLGKTKRMFLWWHRVRDGTMTREQFQKKMHPLKLGIYFLLREATICGVPKVERSAQKILGVFDLLWTFVYHEGVEPTNNNAERPIRHAVMWRKSCYGTQSEAGSRFVERILTVHASCQLQCRNVVDFVTQACVAYFNHQPAPTLIPQKEQPAA